MPSAYQASDGLFHFVFANEDLYVSSSGIRYNLKRWLYRSLSEEYRNIFFIALSKKGTCSVTVYDRDSWDKAQEQNKSFVLLPIKNTAEYVPGKAGAALSMSGESVLKLMVNLSHSAFVFPLSSFSVICANKEAFLSSLISQNGYSKNVILIQGMISDQYNRRFFTDSSGIFHKKTQTGYLFPEIVQAFFEAEDCPEGNYRKLQKLLGNNCVFLNQFSRRDVKRTVRCAVWHAVPSLEALDDEEIDKAAEFTYMWYHCDQVQAEWSGCFQPNAKHEFSMLYKDLVSNWDAIEEASEVYTEKEKDSAKRDFAEDIPEPLCIKEDILVKQLKGIRFTRDLNPRGRLGNPERIELQKVIRLFQRPGISHLDPEILQILQKCVEKIDRSVLRGDSQTFFYACECLNHAVNARFASGEKRADFLKRYLLLMEMSHLLFEMESDMSSDKQHLSKLIYKFNGVMDELDDMKTSGDSLGFSSKVGHADNISEQIKLAKSLFKTGSDQVSVLRSHITKLDAMLKYELKMQEFQSVQEFQTETAGEIHKIVEQEVIDPEEVLRNLLDSKV